MSEISDRLRVLAEESARCMREMGRGGADKTVLTEWIAADRIEALEADKIELQDRLKTIKAQNVEMKADLNLRVGQVLEMQARCAENARLRAALDMLQQAEQTYRVRHDRYTSGHTLVGRAWDLMRRAGDKGRAALEATNDPD